MEALAFGTESTQSCHSKFQRAGHSERIRFVSYAVAGVESGARQPIQLCNNSALTQGHTRNTLNRSNQVETQIQSFKSARIPSQSMNPLVPILGISNTVEIVNFSQFAKTWAQ